MSPRRPPVVEPDEIRDDWATRSRKPYRGRRGANPEGRVSRASRPAEAPTEKPRPWVPPAKSWPTFDLLYERVPRYSMDMVREYDLP